VAEIAREEPGAPAGRAMMAFIFLALVYVIVAFADITAGTFESGSEELQAGSLSFHPGGAVAIASVLYLGLALAMGLVQRYLKPPLWVLTILFVPATASLSWLGPQLSHWLVLDHRTWALLILVYCVVAAVTPVWLLLQPRGYLGGFVLYGALAAGLVGIFFGGHAIQQPAFKAWEAPKALGSLFPFLVTTPAARSGFHGLMCRARLKQIAKESACASTAPCWPAARLRALATIMIAADEDIAGSRRARSTARGRALPTTLVGEDRPPSRPPSRHGLLDLRLRHAGRVRASGAPRRSLRLEGARGAVAGTL
jgi:carbon starvation protein